MALTLQTFVIFARRCSRRPCCLDLPDLSYLHGGAWGFLMAWPFRLSPYLHGGASGFLMALILQVFILFARRRKRLSCGCDLSDFHHILHGGTCSFRIALTLQTFAGQCLGFLMSQASRAFIIFARRRSTSRPCGLDLPDFHHSCTAVLKAFLRP